MNFSPFLWLCTQCILWVTKVRLKNTHVWTGWDSFLSILCLLLSLFFSSAWWNRLMDSLRPDQLVELLLLYVRVYIQHIYGAFFPAFLKPPGSDQQLWLIISRLPSWMHPFMFSVPLTSLRRKNFKTRA